MKSIFKFLLIVSPLSVFAESGAIVDPQLLVLVLLGIIVFILLFLVLKVVEIYFFFENQEREKSGLPSTSFGKIINEKYFIGEQNLKSGSIMLPHSYDGISELNNGMPPWLKYVFISTVIFAASYISYFFVFEIGTPQKEEYETEILAAKISVDEYLAKAANSIDESNVQLVLSDKGALENGKAIFMQNCKVCHGAAGQGGIGPNLTDNYWLHGGSVQNIFKTIKYGITEKGMISWKQKLRPIEMQEVSNYIVSLKGTNPAEAKAAEGALEQ